MKQAIQGAIRRAHLFFKRPLPDKIGIYLHDLPPDDWPAFRRSVESLREMGYRFVGLDSFFDSNGRVAFLSFDDNFRSWYEALDMFADLDVPCTFYVNTLPIRDFADEQEIAAYYRRLGRSDGRGVPLSKAELVAILDAGHELGSHAHTHHVLSSLSFDDASAEIALSKEILEDIAGHEIVHFSHPFGMRRHTTNELRAFCRDLGFQTLANAIPGLQFAGQQPAVVHRTLWYLDLPFEHNVDNLMIDGRVFERLTGRAAIARC